MVWLVFLWCDYGCHGHTGENTIGEVAIPPLAGLNNKPHSDSPHSIRNIVKRKVHHDSQDHDNHLTNRINNHNTRRTTSKRTPTSAPTPSFLNSPSPPTNDNSTTTVPVDTTPTDGTFTVNINANNDKTNKYGTLNFFLIGDWGKGGNDGTVWSSFESVSDRNKEGGGNSVVVVTDDDVENTRTSTATPTSLRTKTSAFSSISTPNSPSVSTITSTAAATAITTTTAGATTTTNNNNNNNQVYQAAIAQSMAAHATSSPPSFILALGDNFYTKGVTSTTDSLWSSLWTDVYLTYTSLKVPWYAVLGNHDYGNSDGPQAEIDRTSIDSYWVMPQQYYSKSYNIPGGGLLVTVFVDTTTLAPSVNQCCNEKGDTPYDTYIHPPMHLNVAMKKVGGGDEGTC